MLSEGLQHGGLGGGDSEICFSVERSLQEAVPGPGEPAETFTTVTRALASV